MPGIQRGAACVFLVVMLFWLDSLPTPWFEREAPGGVVSFNYHPLCMTLAFVVMMPEALVVYADGEDSRGWTHLNAKRVHTLLHGLSTLFLVMGLMAIFANHSGHGVPPMYSAHSWMGLVTTVLVSLQALVGVVIYFFTPAVGLIQGLTGVGSPAITNDPARSVSELRKLTTPYHRFFGCAAFTLGITTVCSGFVEKQAFIKCQIDPMYKYCTALQLPNVLVVLAATIGACAIGTIYARASRQQPDRAQWSEEEQREDARTELMSASRQRRSQRTEEVDDLEY